MPTSVYNNPGRRSTIYFIKIIVMYLKSRISF